jgi:hypothetical protein
MLQCAMKSRAGAAEMLWWRPRSGKAQLMMFGKVRSKTTVSVLLQTRRSEWRGNATLDEIQEARYS